MTQETTNTQNLKSQVLIRAATESDASFILDSWLSSYRRANAVRSISEPIYFLEHHKLLEKLLKKATVLVACNTTDNDQIYGYLVASKIEDIPVLHYAYTKYIYRRLGIANMLAAEFGFKPELHAFYTHETIAGRQIVTSKNKMLVFNPYLLDLCT